MTDIETIVLTAASGEKKTWRLSLFPDVLKIEGVDHSLTIVIPNAEIPDKAEMTQLWPLAPVLALKLPKKSLFNLKRADAATLRAWWPKGTRIEIKTMFKKRFWLGAILGALFLLTSLPVAGSTGIEAIAVDPEGALIGALLIIFAVIARWMPFRHLFLFECVLCFVAAIDSITRVVQGESHWIWLILAWTLLSAAHSEYLHWKRFDSLSELSNIMTLSDESPPRHRNNNENWK